jgi:proline iminopeptidase
MEIPIQEGYIPFCGYRTWYRIVGEQEETGKAQLVCLHGGPGATHDYFQPLERLANTGRCVILYDQLGWGNSDHIHDPAM